MTYTQGQEDRQKRATRGHRADTLTLRRIRRDGERASARERGKAWEAPMEVRLHMIVQTVTAVTVNRKPVRCFLADSEADTALLNLSTRSDREGEW